MELIQRTVYYCSVSESGKILCSYNSGGTEMENLGVQCLEKSPPYHQWYFQTMGKKTFGFLMDEGYMYFVIVNDTLGKAEAFKFLEHLRDEFRKVVKKGLSRSMSNLNSVRLQERLVPAIRCLVTSFENVSRSPTEWPVVVQSSDQVNSSSVGPSDGGGSTKAPLLGKSTKHDKKRTKKDHIISVKDIDLEERRKSAERGNKVDSGPLDSANGRTSIPPISLQKESGSFRTRSSSQNIRKKWCRQVRIVLAIDAVVCLVLFAVWLLICKGFKCVR